jgi:hypothetical protein
VKAQEHRAHGDAGVIANLAADPRGSVAACVGELHPEPDASLTRLVPGGHWA